MFIGSKGSSFFRLTKRNYELLQALGAIPLVFSSLTGVKNTISGVKKKKKRKYKIKLTMVDRGLLQIETLTLCVT